MITDLKTGKKYNNLYDYYSDFKNCESITQAKERIELLHLTGMAEGKDWHLTI